MESVLARTLLVKAGRIVGGVHFRSTDHRPRTTPQGLVQPLGIFKIRGVSAAAPLTGKAAFKKNVFKIRRGCQVQGPRPAGRDFQNPGGERGRSPDRQGRGPLLTAVTYVSAFAKNSVRLPSSRFRPWRVLGAHSRALNALVASLWPQ